MNFFGKIFVILGFSLILFGTYLLWQRNNPNRISFDSQPVLANFDSIQPTRLIISSQQVDLPIIESRVINHKWEVTDKGVNRIGNVYYGHNWTNLLGNLTKVKPGELIEVKFVNGTSKKYSVTLTQEVNPDQKDVLNLATDNTILIYTCSGFLDSKRFIVVAERIF